MTCPQCGTNHAPSATICQCGYNFGTGTLQVQAQTLPDQPEASQSQLDQTVLREVMFALEAEQNLPLGFAGGLIAAIVAAIIWAVVTVTTGYQIGWMSMGVGFLVGYAVRTLGKGLSKTYGIVGASLSLLGCALGNLFSTCLFISKQEAIPILTVVSHLNLSLIIELLKATFSPMDVLFYGIAVYEGYRFSFRQISQQEILTRARLKKP